MVNGVIDKVNVESLKKVYKERGGCGYDGKMMVKVIM